MGTHFAPPKQDTRFSNISMMSWDRRVRKYSLESRGKQAGMHFDVLHDRIGTYLERSKKAAVVPGKPVEIRRHQEGHPAEQNITRRENLARGLNAASSVLTIGTVMAFPLGICNYLEMKTHAMQMIFEFSGLANTAWSRMGEFGWLAGMAIVIKGLDFAGSLNEKRAKELRTGTAQAFKDMGIPVPNSLKPKWQ